MVLDARWLKTGIGRYTLSLLKGLRDKHLNIDVTCITQPQHAELVSCFCDRVIVSRPDIYTIQEQLVLPWIARQATAFYAPHYNVPIMWRHKLLVTIHDLNHLLDATYRNSWRSRLYAKPLLKIAVKTANVIVVPSNYTKTMLNRYLDVSSDRITVIPCPVSQEFYPKDKIQSRSNIERDYGIKQPYLLFVGSMVPNKNVPLLLSAFSRLRHLRRDAPILVVVGGSGNRKREMQIYANTLGLQDAVVWLEDLSNASLSELYSAALMTIMPSLEEGFGLPVIESMACGTPVICSEAASLPEVAGDASFFFSPHSLEHLTETIVRLMDSTDEQKRLIASGLSRSRMYSQENFVLRQASAIRELLSA